MGLGLAFALAEATAPTDQLRNAIYLVSLAQLIAVTVFSAWRYRPPARVWMPILFVLGCAGVAQVLSGDSTVEAGSPLSARLLLLVGQVVLIVALFLVVRHRGIQNPNGALGDALILALGAWLVVWVSLVRPALDHSTTSTASTVAGGLYQTLAIVVLCLLALLLYSDTTRSTAIWLISLAIGFTLVGDLAYAVIESGQLDIPVGLANAPYILGHFMLSAALLEPSIRSLPDPAPAREVKPLVTRLVATTGALVIPVLVVALTGPDGRVDQIVLGVSALVLGVAVTIRVIQAVQSNHVAQAELMRSAQTDPLTGLPNRSLLLEHIGEALRASWSNDRRPTVLFVDIDRFKHINDSLGHAEGDAVLRAVARRLTNALPDHVVIGRISGDEFVVLDGQTTDEAAAWRLAERVLATFREPLALAGGEFYVRASIGIAIANERSTTTAEGLLQHADTAMYRAKESGRDCITLFNDEMLDRVKRRLEMQTGLQQALHQGNELRLVYQPIMDLERGEVSGFEALMRWERSDGTLVSPALFIPIAEESELIGSLGRWAVLTALDDLRKWIDDGVCRPDATVSVNVSARQLTDRTSDLITSVDEALRRTGLPARHLWLEVTESVMISEPELALSRMKALQDLGVRIALDDFGTGYSSLSLLQQFPIECIKIDRSFVSGIAGLESGTRNLVSSIIAMGTALHMDLVAEGVESLPQLRVLQELGCRRAQGFLISHPVSPEAVSSTVRALDHPDALSMLGVSPLR